MDSNESRDNWKLSALILKELSASENIHETIFDVLKKVCAYFSMDHAFVYEADHTSRLLLKEHHNVDQGAPLPRSLVLTERLAEKEIESLTRDPYVCFCAAHRNDDPADRKLAELLNAYFYVVIPIKDVTGALSGLVGMSRNTCVRCLDENELQVARSALSLIAHQSQLRIYQQKLEFSRQSLESTLDNTGVDIYVNDFYTHEILYVNQSMAKPYGGFGKLVGKKCWQTLYDDKTGQCDFCPQKKLVDENGAPTKVYSWDYQRPFDGAWFRVFSAAFRWVDGRLAHVVSSVDITENKNNEMLIQRMAFYDALTNIYNRRKFELDFEHVLNRSQALNESGFIVFLDLDNFKYINDVFGHETGDQMLAQVASYINGLPVCKGHVYRYGGDEFILLFENASLESTARTTDQIVERFKRPWRLGMRDYYCTASIGVAAFPQNGTTYNDLLTSADAAMYKSKKEGKSRVSFYVGETTQEASAKLEKEFALREAIKNDFSEFVLQYHPLVDASSRQWVGTEALLRWNSPRFGLLPPKQFIGMAEDLGLIVPLGKWVLRSAIQNMLEWGIWRERRFLLNVNISLLQLRQDDFDSFISALLEELKAPANELLLEITDSVALTNEQGLYDKIEKLRGKGLHIAIGGLGKGYSSLSALRHIRVDLIKIDRNFVHNALENEYDRTVVNAVAALAHAARAKVCAEGVDKPEILDFLLQNGYDCLQGTYFSHPVDFGRFKRLYDKEAKND